MLRNKQLNIFKPSLNPVDRLKAVMRRTIKDGKFSREQLCDRMNEAARYEGLNGGGRHNKITVAMLDSWVAESKANMIPIALLPLFCSAAETLEPLGVLAACLEAAVISGDEMLLLQVAKLEKEEKKLAKKRKRMAMLLEE